MGATHVTVIIRNPAVPEKYWEGLSLVDSGAIDSLVPRDHLGASVTEPILGVTALESVGIEIDPKNQELKRMPATRLKKMKPAKK